MSNEKIDPPLDGMEVSCSLAQYDCVSESGTKSQDRLKNLKTVQSSIQSYLDSDTFSNIQDLTKTPENALEENTVINFTTETALQCKEQTIKFVLDELETYDKLEFSTLNFSETNVENKNLINSIIATLEDDIPESCIKDKDQHENTEISLKNDILLSGNEKKGDEELFENDIHPVEFTCMNNPSMNYEERETETVDKVNFDCTKPMKTTENVKDCNSLSNVLYKNNEENPVTLEKATLNDICAPLNNENGSNDKFWNGETHFNHTDNSPSLLDGIKTQKSSEYEIYAENSVSTRNGQNQAINSKTFIDENATIDCHHTEKSLSNVKSPNNTNRSTNVEQEILNSSCCSSNGFSNYRDLNKINPMSIFDYVRDVVNNHPPDERNLSDDHISVEKIPSLSNIDCNNSGNFVSSKMLTIAEQLSDTEEPTVKGKTNVIFKSGCSRSRKKFAIPWKATKESNELENINKIPSHKEISSMNLNTACNPIQCENGMSPKMQTINKQHKKEKNIVSTHQNTEMCNSCSMQEQVQQVNETESNEVHFGGMNERENEIVLNKINQHNLATEKVPLLEKQSRKEDEVVEELVEKTPNECLSLKRGFVSNNSCPLIENECKKQRIDENRLQLDPQQSSTMDGNDKVTTENLEHTSLACNIALNTSVSYERSPRNYKESSNKKTLPIASIGDIREDESDSDSTRSSLQIDKCYDRDEMTLAKTGTNDADNVHPELNSSELTNAVKNIKSNEGCSEKLAPEGSIFASKEIENSSISTNATADFRYLNENEKNSGKLSDTNTIKNLEETVFDKSVSHHIEETSQTSFEDTGNVSKLRNDGCETRLQKQLNNSDFCHATQNFNKKENGAKILPEEPQSGNLRQINKDIENTEDGGTSFYNEPLKENFNGTVENSELRETPPYQPDYSQTPVDLCFEKNIVKPKNKSRIPKNTHKEHDFVPETEEQNDVAVVKSRRLLNENGTRDETDVLNSNSQSLKLESNTQSNFFDYTTSNFDDNDDSCEIIPYCKRKTLRKKSGSHKTQKRCNNLNDQKLLLEMLENKMLKLENIMINWNTKHKARSFLQAQRMLEKLEPVVAKLRLLYKQEDNRKTRHSIKIQQLMKYFDRLQAKFTDFVKRSSVIEYTVKNGCKTKENATEFDDDGNIIKKSRFKRTTHKFKSKGCKKILNTTTNYCGTGEQKEFENCKVLQNVFGDKSNAILVHPPENEKDSFTSPVKQNEEHSISILSVEKVNKNSSKNNLQISSRIITPHSYKNTEISKTSMSDTILKPDKNYSKKCTSRMNDAENHCLEYRNKFNCVSEIVEKTTVPGRKSDSIQINCPLEDESEMPLLSEDNYGTFEAKSKDKENETEFLTEQFNILSSDRDNFHASACSVELNTESEVDKMQNVHQYDKDADICQNRLADSSEHFDVPRSELIICNSQSSTVSCIDTNVENNFIPESLNVESEKTILFQTCPEKSKDLFFAGDQYSISNIRQSMVDSHSESLLKNVKKTDINLNQIQVLPTRSAPDLTKYQGVSVCKSTGVKLTPVQTSSLLQQNKLPITEGVKLVTNNERKASNTSHNLVSQNLYPKSKVSNKEIKPELWKFIESDLLKPDNKALTVHTPEKLFFASIHETGRIIADDGKSYDTVHRWCLSIPNFSQKKVKRSECFKRVYYQGHTLEHLVRAYEGLTDSKTSPAVKKTSCSNGGSTAPVGSDLLPVVLNLSEMKLLLIGNNEVERTIPEIDQWVDIDRW